MVEEREMVLGVSQMTVQAAPVIQAVQVATLRHRRIQGAMVARAADSVATLDPLLPQRGGGATSDGSNSGYDTEPNPGIQETWGILVQLPKKVWR